MVSKNVDIKSDVSYRFNKRVPFITNQFQRDFVVSC